MACISMANGEKILEISGFKLDESACGLITSESLNGTLYASNWLTSVAYKNEIVVAPVNYARNLLNGKSDREIKDIWLAIESICARWRSESNMQILPNQKLLPIETICAGGQMHIWQLAKDGDLFFYLESLGVDALPESLRADFSAILANGIKLILAITLLYEHYIGRPNDVMQTYSSLLAFQAKELKPDASRGRKVKNSAALGHESVYGTQQEKQSKWEEYQAFVNDLYKKNPSLSYVAMKERAAKHFGVASKTIQRHTVNPKAKR